VDGGFDKFRSLSSTLRYFVPTYGVVDSYVMPDKFQSLLDTLEENSGSGVNLVDPFQNALTGKSKAYADYRSYLASLTEINPHNDQFSESRVGQPVEQYEFDNRLFSRASLNYLLGINYFKKICGDKNIKTILEIGGGFGSFGEILLGDTRNDVFYIDVDLPPTACVATFYLQSIFGCERIGDYTMLRESMKLDINELKKDYSSVVLCPWQLPRLVGNIDLFVNFISFQEMEPEIVENYLQHVMRLNARYLLLRNLREGKQKAKNDSDIGVKTPILGVDYDRFLPGYSLLGTNTVPFGYETDDGFHSELRVYCRE
jgi:putative sugar O-methyltransferase